MTWNTTSNHILAAEISVGPGKDHDTIQAAVDAAVSGDHVVVEPGTYLENVTIGKNIKLISSEGAGATTIVGSATATPSPRNLGTVVLDGATTAVQIGDAGQGFTIVGFDGLTAGLETSALYFRGPHDDAIIRGNVFFSNGDSALLTEWGNIYSGLEIVGNRFTGASFVEIPAGDSGSSGQFTTPNVPRHPIFIGSPGNVPLLTFSDNVVESIAGGANSDGKPQGVHLATIYASSATITGNVFSGVTQREGAYALRLPEGSSTLEDNTFVSDGLTEGAGFIIAPAADLAIVLGANQFDQAVASGDGPAVEIPPTLQESIDAAAEGAVLIVSESEFDEDIRIHNQIIVLGSPTINGTLTVEDGGGLTPGYSPGAIISGDLILGDDATTEFEIEGPSPGNGHDQLDVTGSVSIDASASFTILGAHVPVIGEEFVLINNDDNDSITGAFNGAAEGQLFFLNGIALAASYTGGDGNDFTLTAVKAPTMTALEASVNPTRFGQSTTFNATVSPIAPATAIPTGSVAFRDGGIQILQLATLNQFGQASMTTAALSVGDHAITVEYLGNAIFTGSSSAELTQVVEKADTDTLITQFPAGVHVIGQTVSVSFMVAVSGPGSGEPSGNVVVSDGSSSGAGTAAAGMANVTLLGAGVRNFTAGYVGDDSFNGSASPSATLTVLDASDPTVVTAGAIDDDSPEFRQTGLLSQTITITNPTPLPFDAVRVLLELPTEQLEAGIHIFNASGTNTASIPYLQHNFAVPAGGAVELTAEYYAPDRTMTPTPATSVELVAPEVVAIPDGELIGVAEFRAELSGFLIEFPTENDARYAILYSEDMSTWKAAQPTVSGNGSRLQWLDNGPPKTDRRPTGSPAQPGPQMRVYQVLKLN